jgi:hypothetical protein
LSQRALQALQQALQALHDPLQQALQPHVPRLFSGGSVTTGPPLEELNLPVLKSIADVLGVKVRDLLSEEDWLALQPVPA